MNDELQAVLRPIIERFGIEAVRKALRDYARFGRARGRRSNGRAARKRGRSRLTAVEYVQKMGLPEERAAVMGRAAAEFERRAFLPTLGDIRSFCETYGIDVPKSTSRAAGIPRVFHFLESMNTADIETMLDEQLFSGPVELGPIAEAIRGRARQIREVAATQANEGVALGEEDGFDPGVQAEVWEAAKAEARETLRQVASRRATVSYTELVARINSLDLEPQDRRLRGLLGQISSEEDESGRGLLSVLVVHRGGDQRPGAGFFEMARSRGRDVTDPDRCWLEELEVVHRYWGAPRRRETERSVEPDEDDS